jgi:hypothetical protein
MFLSVDGGCSHIYSFDNSQGSVVDVFYVDAGRSRIYSSDISPGGLSSTFLSVNGGWSRIYDSCRYSADWVPLCTRLKKLVPRPQICSRFQRALALPHVPRHRARHPPEEDSGVATCPWHKARHLSGKGSSVVMCPEAPCMPPAMKGLQCCHIPRGTEPVTR